MATFNEEKQEKQLKELRLKEAEDIARLLSQKYKLPYADLTLESINTDALRLIAEDEARAAEIAPYKLTGKKVHVGIKSPGNEKTKMAVRELAGQGYEPALRVVSPASLKRAWNYYREISAATEVKAGVIDIQNEQIISFVKEVKNLNEVKENIEKTLAGEKKYHISQFAEVLIASALVTEASDIHIEPQENGVRLRLRIDGVLQDIAAFDYKLYRLLLSRIKLVSGLKLNVKNEPQGGRFTIKLENTEVEVRSSVIPEAYGESIVLRVLNPLAIHIPFEELGMGKRLFSILSRETGRPNGMILNTGPTGSGKTTTLYAILTKIKTPEMKIITIEDPIEYHLSGITQTQVEEGGGYTFLEGLRSALRQDPNIIMVGEIRDNETAGTAIHASLTGHLVLSTLHTNSAAGAIPRLIDLGVNPKIIGSSVNIFIAQRLVRRLCEACKVKDAPTDGEKRLIGAILSDMPDIGEPLPATDIVWRAHKCEKCNNTGYKRRIGVFEAILMNKTIEELATRNPSEREIRRAAMPQKIPNLRQDGILKILRGTTTFEELRRVIDLEEAV